MGYAGADDLFKCFFILPCIVFLGKERDSNASGNKPTIRNESLFAYILMLIKRLPSDDERKQFRDKLNRIVKKYKENIDFTLIGFPNNYMELMHIKNLKNIV